MSNKNQYRLSILAMTSGLLLLSLFMGWWLKQGWDKEVQRFGKYVDDKLEASIQQVEDSLTIVKVGNKFNVNTTSNGVTFSIRSRRIRPYAAAMSISVEARPFEGMEGIKISQDDVLELVVDKTNALVDYDFGNLGEVVLVMDSVKSITRIEPIDTILSRYQQNFDLGTTFPPAIFLMVDSLDAKEAFEDGISRAFFYSEGGHIFAAQIPNYRWHIFKEMFWQFLFSFILLGLLGLAFYLINRSLLQQERLSKMKNDFISNITHELKTPITTVGVALEAMENFNAMDDPERAKEYIKISKGELNRLSILVDNVLKMSIFEGKQPVFKKEKLNLKEVCKEVLSSMQLQFEKKRARVDFEVEGNSFIAEADKVHFTNVIYNLIENALKYNDKTPHIQVRLSDSVRHLYIEVEDNGIGIAKEYQDKVFGKFFRVPRGDTHNFKGHGLGLTYVAKVVEAHGGIIDVESELGERTKFKITIPKSQN